MNSKHKPKSKSTTPASSSNSLFGKAHDTLAPLIPILTSFAHRNHNQHRTSHWWSAFNIFRRSVRNLDTVLIKGKEPSIRTHASWMSSHVIPRAYVAFTQLTADNQYASLGLMLIAVLAHVASVLSDLVPSETPPDMKNTSTITSTPRQNISPSLDTSGLDRGVTISREELRPSNHPATTKTSSSKQPKPKLEAPGMNEKPKKRKDKESSGDVKPKKKKKKKAGDELSSLFGSLS